MSLNKQNKISIDRIHFSPSDSFSVGNQGYPNSNYPKTLGGSIMGAYSQNVPANSNFILDIPVSTLSTGDISTEADFGNFLHGVIVRAVASTSTSSTSKSRNTHMIRGVNYFFLDENGNPKSFTNNGFLNIITSSPSSGSPLDIINTSPSSMGFSFINPNFIRFLYKGTVAHVGSAHYTIF